MTASVSIIVEKREDVLRVPASALRFRPAVHPRVTVEVEAAEAEAASAVSARPLARPAGATPLSTFSAPRARIRRRSSSV